MNAYQQFLDFFATSNKERLDGLSESYFAPMTPEERAKAFDFLAQMLEHGGSEEVIHGLFRADPSRARPMVDQLLESGGLRDEAQIAAAWNLYKDSPDVTLLAVFVRQFSNPNAELRGKAAYYVPSNELTPELKSGLQGMIRTETDRLALVHATNKLLECYGITRESVDKDEFSRLYRGLRSDDPTVKEHTFEQLDALYT